MGLTSWTAGRNGRGQDSTAQKVPPSPTFLEESGYLNLDVMGIGHPDLWVGLGVQGAFCMVEEGVHGLCSCTREMQSEGLR